MEFSQAQVFNNQVFTIGDNVRLTLSSLQSIGSNHDTYTLQLG